MTRIIPYGSQHVFLLGQNKAVFIAFQEEDFQLKDVIILQDGRNETKYVVDDVMPSNALKKNTVMLNLTKEEI